MQSVNQKPDNYLVWAILSTVLCCWPFGVVAIVKASKVDSLWASGCYDEACQASKDAKKWSIISAVSVGLFLVFYFLFSLGLYMCYI